MNDGRKSGFNYWNLSYKAKFKRTLFMVPLAVLSIILLLLTDLPIATTITLSVILIVTTAAQLIYTYKKTVDTSYAE